MCLRNTIAIMRKLRNVSGHSKTSIRIKCSSAVLGKPRREKNIWVITLGKGETEKKPAMAIVGGADERHLLGVEMAMGLAERILTRPTLDDEKDKEIIDNNCVISDICRDETIRTSDLHVPNVAR